jgi:hypothetical protein
MSFDLCFLLVWMRKKVIPARAIAPNAAPTPIPALAPADNLFCVEAAGVLEKDEGDEI